MCIEEISLFGVLSVHSHFGYSESAAVAVVVVMRQELLARYRRPPCRT